MLRIPRLTESWCGCSLQTGTKIISIVSVLGKLWSVILFSVLCGFLNSVYDNPNDEKHRAILGILVVLLIVSICNLMVSVLLVISAYKQRPNLAKPWLVVSMFSLGIEVIVFISSIAIGDLRVALITPIQIGFGLYFWLVVYNFCQELHGTPLLGTNYGDIEGAQEDPLLRPFYQSS